MRSAPLLFLLTACLHERPETVLAHYLRAESDGRYEAAWELLDATDQAARPLEAYAADHARAGIVWLAVARETEFDLGQPTEVAGGMTIEVIAHHPQMRAAADTIGKALGIGDLPPDEVGARVEEAARILQVMPVATVDEKIRYVLHPKDKSWRVWMGLAEQDAAIVLAVRAGKAADEGDAAAERAALEALLKLSPDGQGVVARLQEDARVRLGQLP